MTVGVCASCVGKLHGAGIDLTPADWEPRKVMCYRCAYRRMCDGYDITTEDAVRMMAFTSAERKARWHK